jgi:hypothetical protein
MADDNKEFPNDAWLTPGLVKDIEQQFPVANGVDSSTNHDQYNYDLYLTKVTILIFPPGRKFASFKQLTHICKMSLEAWAIVKVQSQNKIHCFYGPSTKTKQDLHIVPEKWRYHIDSLKKELQVSFFRLYTPLSTTTRTPTIQTRGQMFFILLKLPGFTTTIHVCLTLSMPGKPSRGTASASRKVCLIGLTPIFLHNLKNARKLEWHLTQDGDAAVVRPQLGLQTHTSDKIIVVAKNNWCPCAQIMAFKCQCSHEFAVDGAFFLNKWWDRMCNIQTYGNHVILL